MRSKELICPCCGLRYFNNPDFYEYCELCGWQDDPVQRENPSYDGGANIESLNERKKSWKEDHNVITVEDYLEVELNEKATFGFADLSDLKNLTPDKTYEVKEIIRTFNEIWYVLNDDLNDGNAVAYKSDFFRIVDIGERERTIFGMSDDEDIKETIACLESSQRCDEGLLLHKAIEFAAYAHRKQTRKGGDMPYITHPFEVAMLLQKENCDVETVIAGLLHDTVEDADITLEEIREQFGDRVCELVASNSEDKTKSWIERKEHTIDEMLGCADYDVLMLCCADKTANLRSMMTDFIQVGDKLWERFNAPKEDIRHYYSRLNDAFYPLNETDLYWENTRLYQNIFVKCYIDEEEKILYQTDGEAAYIYEDMDWNSFPRDEVEKMTSEKKIKQISNEDVYCFERFSNTGEIEKYLEYKKW